ncbi:MAG: hypothetical protein EOO09_07000 [Chitinophagaceae bacterium]|nr:MAG: hypothetical protein EOO09_07000 [Chitinophagaceae bacterium]
MNKLLTGFLASAVIMLSSCETTREITINQSGKGTIATTIDMGGLLGMAKMSGQGEQMEKMDRPMDTTINLSAIADSVPDLTPEQRKLMKGGVLKVKMDMPQDQFTFKVDFPFENVADIAAIDKLTGKVMQEATKKTMKEGGEGEGMPEGMMPDGEKAGVDQYFVTTYSKGLIETKLDADKYATMADNEMLQGLKEVAGMGMGKTTVVINLPNAAKKVTGANLVLSEDKKKVTITSSLEDFFDDAKKMEYRIEY